MPELDYITVNGFKSIASIEKFRLGPINVVIGANGSGKSNFIEVFSFLHALREARLQDYVGRAGGAERLLYFGSKTTKRLSIKLSFANETNQYEITLVPREGDQLYPASEIVCFWNKHYPPPSSGPSRAAERKPGSRLPGTIGSASTCTDTWIDGGFTNFTTRAAAHR